MISARPALSPWRALMNHPMSNWAEIPVSWTSYKLKKKKIKRRLPFIRPLSLCHTNTSLGSGYTLSAALHCLGAIVVLKPLRVTFIVEAFSACAVKKCKQASPRDASEDGIISKRWSLRRWRFSNKQVIHSYLFDYSSGLLMLTTNSSSLLLFVTEQAINSSVSPENLGDWHTKPV